MTENGRINMTALTTETGLGAGSEGSQQAFIAFVAKKDVEESAPIFVNYAREEDFAKAKETIADLKKIVIAKYGKISVADKVKNALKHEVKGMILYPDPDDFAQNGVQSHNVYPNTWWLSGTGIIRNSAIFSAGDPQSPTWPSIAETHKTYGKYLEWSLPSIPVQPVSYNDARQILSSLGGTQEAPQGWRGGLGINYKLGGVNMENLRKLRLVTTNELVPSQVQNIIGTIKGHIEPDRYVIIGTHRDSWSFGAADSAAGTAALIGIVGAIEETMKAYGWRPRRTLIFASFGASKFGQIGAQEWLEQHLPKLQHRVVAFINLDSIVTGPDIDSTASIPLRPLILKALKSVPDPMDPSNYDRTYFDYWSEKTSGGYMQPNEPYVNYLGSNGVDSNPFHYLAGIAAINVGFSNSQLNVSMKFPTQNTGFDTIQLYQRILDPEFKILGTCSQVVVHVIR